LPPDGSPYDVDTITERFERAAQECTAVIRIRFHDMRHTHATLLLESGATERQVAERLGITIEMVHETYGRVTPKMRASALANLGAALATARVRSVSDSVSKASGKWAIGEPSPTQPAGAR